MSKIYFILGGARSGKSSFSEELAMSLSDRVGYFATGQVIDVEMKKRIEIHKKRRPPNWRTFEIENSDIGTPELKKVFSGIREYGPDVLIIDCITNLVFRLMHKYGLDELEIMDNKLENEIEDEITGFFEEFTGIIKDIVDKEGISIIIVSNEAGMGVVPAYPLGRLFRDLLGLVNKKIAVAADEVHFFVAGIKMRIK